MKILLTGIAPNTTVLHNKAQYINGRSLDVDEAVAQAYIKAGIAKEIKTEQDEAEIVKLQQLEEKNAVRRKQAVKSAQEDGGGL